jgi:RNA polymerase sigma-70 factor (ECF subfamily)
MSEEELMAAVIRGDQLAYQTLVRAHLPAINRYTQRLLGGGRDTEDIAQETFLRLWTTAARWDPDKAKLSTWLHRIAHNLCIDFLRKQKRVVLTASFDENNPIEGEITPSSNEGALRSAIVERSEQQPSSADNIEQEEEFNALHSALATLSEAQRSAILLCHFQGFSNKEAAAIMNVSVQALESLIARAKRGLRAQLEATRNEDT